MLENNFGEKKSCEELFDDLRAVTFNKTTIDFYNDIKYRLRRLCDKAVMILGEGEAANQVALNNQRSALHVFKNKMPEPMRTVLACRNPSSLEEAMDILFENGYDRMGKDCRIVKRQDHQRQRNKTNRNKRIHQKIETETIRIIIEAIVEKITFIKIIKITTVITNNNNNNNRFYHNQNQWK